MAEKVKKKGKHILGKIFLGLLFLLIVFVTVNGIKNGKIMNNTIQAGIDALAEEYTLTELEVGEYETVKIYGIMKFKCKCYKVEGLGHLCVMTTNMGLMQMSSFILSPFEKDMPEMCLDFVYMFSVRKGYVEFYDLSVNGEAAEYKSVISAIQTTVDEFNYMENCKPEEKWYDQYLVCSTFRATTSAEETAFNDLFVKPIATYAQESTKLPALSVADVETKKGLIQDYSDKLIELGGVSTDIFKKALGADVTKDFFDTVFYGTAR